jgi:hypothetical protein
MGLRYYDPVDNRLRIKRRYVWSLWSFGCGLLAGGALIYAVSMLH